MPETRSGPGSARLWVHETDLFSVLFRFAFVVAFALAPSFYPVPWDLSTVGMAIVVVALLFTAVVLFAVVRGGQVQWQRPFALAVDLALVSVALHTTGQTVFFQVYYLIVLESAIWFRVQGAVVTALATAVVYGGVQYALAGGGLTLGEVFSGLAVQAPLLVIVAVVGGYLVVSRDREHEEALRLRQEMLLARTIQDVMLPPRAPHIPGWDVALVMQPALEVGGDLYLLEPLVSGEYVVGLGDISGKSVSGLIYLSLILSHTRAAAYEGLAPRQIARQVNANVYDTLAPETYAGLFVGKLAPASGELSFVSCGHPPPLLISPQRGEVQRLSPGGIVIGAIPEADYAQQQVRLAVGDVLLAYTDGLSEARHRGGEEFGEARIGAAALAALREGCSAEEVAHRVLDEARHWAAYPGQDDATCLVLMRLA